MAVIVLAPWVVPVAILAAVGFVFLNSLPTCSSRAFDGSAFQWPSSSPPAVQIMLR